MAHIKFLCYAPPTVHEDLVKKVNNLRYTHEGSLRVGTVRPFISEWKLYDIRIPKEFEGHVSRDLDMLVPGVDWDGANPDHKQSGAFWLVWLIKIFQWLSPFKAVARTPGDPQLKIDGFKYCIQIGRITDTHQVDMMSGDQKEVL